MTPSTAIPGCIYHPTGARSASFRG